MADHTYTATIHWQRDGQDFADNRYSRAHEWRFDGGVVVPGSPDPKTVPAPMSRPDAVDPEEGLVASVSSCHMLFFLALAAKKGFVVDSYTDEPIGVMTRNERGKLFISSVTLTPRVVWSGTKKPTADDIHRIHERAHDECYIANSLKGEVTVAEVPPVFA